MSTTTASAQTKAAARESFWGPLPCPKCSEEGSITLDMNDGETFVCQECSTDFQLDDIRSFVKRWRRVIAWIDAADGFEVED